MDMRSLFLGVLLPVAGHACSCVASIVPQRACQLVWGYQAVFTGVVTDILDPGLPVYKPGNPPTFENYPQKQITFKVSEAFTGTEPGIQEIVIRTGLGGGDCGYLFERGTEYIVYATQTPRGLRTGICSPTRPTAKAEEDLKYLRTLATIPETGDIRVTAVDLDQRRSRSGDEPQGITGVTVSIEGSGVRRTAATDNKGSTVFSGLSPGEYRVQFSAEGYVVTWPLPNVKLHAKGCADVGLPLRLNRVVTGTVTTRDGFPAAGVRIEAVPVRPRYPHDYPSPADSATTDAEGRYELRNLPFGEYYLGTSLASSTTKENPYPRWFYPGTEDPPAAAFLRIGERPEQYRFDFMLPERQKPRVIEGTVVWPNGSPAADVQVTLEDPRWPSRVQIVKTDSSGRFMAEGFSRSRYRVHATKFSGRPGDIALDSAEPATVEPDGTNPVKLLLVLSRKGNTFTGLGDKELEAWRQGYGLR
jgi:hypothetical protein